MASLCRQIFRVNAVRAMVMSTARRGYADKMMADPLEHAVGLERKELLALQAGNDDPFNMKIVKKAAGTRDSPTLVPSCFDARIVGCVCEEHSTSITWLWLHQSEVARVYLADGFQEDFTELLKIYLRCKPHNYQTFSNVWKEMKFVYIFHGLRSPAELAEYSEEVVLLTKQNMISYINSNMEKSIGALFTMYNLLNLQPIQGFAKVRLVPEDVDSIKKIEAYARESKRYDILYILGSLLIKGHIQYHLSEREYGLERCIKKAFDEPVSVEQLAPMRGVLDDHSELLEQLQAGHGINQTYKHVKMMLQDGKHHGLDYVDENLAGEITSSLKDLFRNPMSLQDPDDEPSGKLTRVHEIKKRAMVNTVPQMRHLVSVRNTESEMSTSKAETDKPIKSKRSKIPCPKLLRITSPKKKKEEVIQNLDEGSDVEDAGYVLPDMDEPADDTYILPDTSEPIFLSCEGLPMINLNEIEVEPVPVVIEVIDQKYPQTEEHKTAPQKIKKEITSTLLSTSEQSMPLNSAKHDTKPKLKKSKMKTSSEQTKK